MSLSRIYILLCNSEYCLSSKSHRALLRRQTPHWQPFDEKKRTQPNNQEWSQENKQNQGKAPEEYKTSIRMSSKPIWILNQPAYLRSGPFRDVPGIYQIHRRYVVDKEVDISVVGISATQEPPTGNDVNKVVLMRCRNFWNNEVSSSNPRQTFGYQTIKISLDNHPFEQRFLITRTFMLILTRDFLNQHNITFDNDVGHQNQKSSKSDLSCHHINTNQHHVKSSTRCRGN